MNYSEAAKTCLERKDYAGYLDNSRRKYAQTGMPEDKRAVDAAEKTCSLHRDITELLKKEHAGHYEVLGVSRNASHEDIERAYKMLVMKFHPDRTKISESSTATALIQKAYHVLGNPEKRRAYDAGGQQASRHTHPDPMQNVFYQFRYPQTQDPFGYAAFYQQMYMQRPRRGQPEIREFDARAAFVIIVVLLFLILQ